LYHEAFDNTVKYVPVVITIATVNAEILHGLWTSTNNRNCTEL